VNQQKRSSGLLREECHSEKDDRCLVIEEMKMATEATAFVPENYIFVDVLVA
jgi:hypothetical protein